ncbi:hypothetical protein VUR80DRAFT_1870 [Thermomyces stellatus]
MVSSAPLSSAAAFSNFPTSSDLALFRDALACSAELGLGRRNSASSGTSSKTRFGPRQAVSQRPAQSRLRGTQLNRGATDPSLVCCSYVWHVRLRARRKAWMLQNSAGTKQLWRASTERPCQQAAPVRVPRAANSTAASPRRLVDSPPQTDDIPICVLDRLQG